jgi:hypothetical protein
MKKDNLLEAVAIAKMNSTINIGRGLSIFSMFRNSDGRMGMGLHPTRNDIDRYGKPVKKKKGNMKQDKNVYK